MERLYTYLCALESQRVSIWYPHQTLPGKDWKRERDSQLQSAHLILFLVSANFFAWEQCENIVPPAMERYRRGEAHIIPIILRPSEWQDTPLGNLQPLPEGGKPVIEEGWKTQDYAFFNIVRGIKSVIISKDPGLLVQQGNGDLVRSRSRKPEPAASEAVELLEQIIQGFKSLRGQIANLRPPKVFLRSSAETCETQYNRLYGDTMVFLAKYLPQAVSGEEAGFVEAVYHKTLTPLQQRNNIPVWLARGVFTSLARLEILAAQIDACVATLEMYKTAYFSQSSPTLVQQDEVELQDGM